jgi:hypothetical protein
VAVWFSRHLVMVKAVSGEAPALGTALAAAVTTGGSPPSNNSAWEGSAHRVVGTSLGDNGS